MEVASWLMVKKTTCRFEVQRDEHCIHTGHTCSIAVRERLLDASICSGIGYDTSS